jgi:hypothetical protein
MTTRPILNQTILSSVLLLLVVTGCSEGGADPSDNGTGSSNSGSGASNNGTGSASNGSGASNDGSGASNDGSGASDIGTGSANDGSGASNDGSGASNDGSGGSNNGTGSSESGSGGNPEDQTDPTIPAAPLADCDAPGPRMIRRLTAAQYANTIRHLMGDGFPVETVLPDPVVLGFHVDADAAVVADLTAELLMNYAESVTAWAIENEPSRLANCDTHDSACHEQVITEFGRRAFRQDLTEEQKQGYLRLFAAESTFDVGLHVVVSTMLQSPFLLYRRELGEADLDSPGEFRLTPYEIASELSYLLTDSPPDDALLDQAEQGLLSTQEEIDQAAEQLLSTQEAERSLAHFVHGWLEVDGLPAKAKDPSVFDLDDAHRQAMLDETDQFFLEIFRADGTISDLYTADFTMLNATLADFYDLGGVSGDAFSRVALDGRRPSGVLGHGSVLTQHALSDNSSPVQRGALVRERLLCQELPPIPENLDTNLAEPQGFTTNRERYAEHSKNAVCSNCHAVLDPVGFAFEEYDAFGRFRETEGGVPVDATGELSEVAGGPVDLDGVQSLSDYLGKSDLARSCLIRYWSYYAYGRDEWDQRECSHDGIRAEAAAGGHGLQDTLFAIIHTPHFTRRVAD